MEDIFKKIYDKIIDIIFAINKKFEKVSDKIFEQTGMKINIGAIVMSALGVIILILVVKSILGWLWGML